MRRFLASTVACALLASSGCAVLGGTFDHGQRNDYDQPYGRCAWTKLGAVADVLAVGVMLLAANEVYNKDPDNNRMEAWAWGAAGIPFAVSAVSGFAGYTCQDGHLFGMDREPEPAPSPTAPRETEDPLLVLRGKCMANDVESCRRLFGQTDSPVVRIDAGTRACKGAPASGICDDVAALLQPTDPARAIELLELGCNANDAEACSALATLRPH